jgi:ATP-dependent helicase HrpB
VIRLYTKEDYERRPEYDAPEITRRELSQLCLDLRAISSRTSGTDPQAGGLQTFSPEQAQEIDWLTPPPGPALEAAEKLLERLNATGPAAAQMARYPLHPRLSRIVIEALRRGVGEDGCIVAALLGSGARLENSDLLAALDSEWDYRTRQHIEQLRRIVRPPKQTRHDDDALLMSVLAGFPDRVARRRKDNQVLLSTGGSAELAGEPPPYEFMVAADIEDRKDKPLPLVRLTARIKPEWLIDLFPDRMEDRNGVEWNRTAERVEAVSALVYDDLTIQESHGAVPAPEAAAILLAQKAMETGVERFADRDQLEEFRVRVEFAELKAPDTAATVERLCIGLRSFTELKALDLIAALEQQVDSRLLNERAPARIRLPNGRQIKVHYERGKPPWVASRLQDFIGMRETPRVGGTPLVVHLLAPNQRAVQTTTDLAGFWERLYPELRRQLSRRYPKHPWPEN